MLLKNNFKNEVKKSKQIREVCESLRNKFELPMVDVVDVMVKNIYRDSKGIKKNAKQIAKQYKLSTMFQETFKKKLN